VAASEPTFARRKANSFLRLCLKMPVFAYRGPLAEFMRSRCVMLLTTTGRNSGKPRTGAVSFMPLGDRFIIFSGWGVSSNWYRNLRKNPEVTITVGRQRMRATARLVEDPERRIDLMRQMRGRSSGCGPPRTIRPLLKMLRIFDYEADLDMAVAAGGSLPVFEILPRSSVS
jgi:deazaflavin-dependent oxidoreductase (nitroreductase family)